MEKSVEVAEETIRECYHEGEEMMLKRWLGERSLPLGLTLMSLCTQLCSEFWMNFVKKQYKALDVLSQFAPASARYNYCACSSQVLVRPSGLVAQLQCYFVEQCILQITQRTLCFNLQTRALTALTMRSRRMFSSSLRNQWALNSMGSRGLCTQICVKQRTRLLPIVFRMYSESIVTL